jgi:uncharacterized protein (TIGR03067 family)
MRYRVPLALLTALLLAGTAHPQAVAPLQGEWRLASTADEKHTDPGCDESRMVVQADGAVAFVLAGRKLNSGIVTFSKSGKFLTLDLKLADGRTLLGFYEQKADELVICFAEGGKERPAGTAPKGSEWSETWKRVKP